MSRHRFTVIAEVIESELEKNGRLDTPDTWDHMDLTEAIVTHTAVIVEVEEEEQFET